MNVETVAVKHETLVLEGCDGVGKSTLATRLACQHGFTITHSPRTPDHLDLVSRYRELLDKPGRLLLDRCFLSELVYGPLLRGRSRLTWTQAIDLAETVVSRNGVFLHLIAPPVVIQQRLLQRDGAAAGLDEISDLVTIYQRTFETLASYCPVETIDTTRLDLPSTG
ncbi:hypothetical protein [Streptomyces alboflavus]|uniref:hypothetical protein n=1 Tax=Streptomyces alboflavus TaxID=67267 RepID=UPI0004C01D2C|nr:hypothetical protein [Streptomyces alboflavus]